MCDMSIEIRHTTPEDWRAVERLLVREFADMTNEMAAAKAVSQGASTSGALFVAMLDDRVAGAAFARPRWWNVPNAWSCEMLIVHPKSRGKGVGLDLTTALEESAREHDVELLIGVCGSRVLPFYTKCGFASVKKGAPILLSDGSLAMAAVTCASDQHFFFKSLVPTIEDPSAIHRTERVKIAPAGNLGAILRADRERVGLR